MDSIDKALLYAQLDRMLSMREMEDDKDNLIAEIFRQIQQLMKMVERYAV